MSDLIRTVPIAPFEGQKPGASGLRKQVRIFQTPGYAEGFLQAIFDALSDKAGATLVVGGDGRFLNQEVIQKALRLAAANGIGRAIVGREGLLSTPAVSHLIRLRGAIGGFVLSASPNPGGPDGDFGIKYNIANGGPAPENVTEAIYSHTRTLSRYLTLDLPDLSLDSLGESRLGPMVVEVIDPVSDYAALMETLIDFDAISTAVRSGLTLRFDALHAVTGPYAVEILERRLGSLPDGRQRHPPARLRRRPARP